MNTRAKYYSLTLGILTGVVKDGFKTFALDACEAADALIAALEGGAE